MWALCTETVAHAARSSALWLYPQTTQRTDFLLDDCYKIGRVAKLAAQNVCHSYGHCKIITITTLSGCLFVQVDSNVLWTDPLNKQWSQRVNCYSHLE